jgi:hypothetical protein
MVLTRARAGVPGVQGKVREVCDGLSGVWLFGDG